MGADWLRQGHRFSDPRIEHAGGGYPRKSACIRVQGYSGVSARSARIRVPFRSTSMINARIVRTAVATLALTAATAAQAGELSSIDRQRLVAHLEMTSSWLIDEVSGLSRAQLEFRPAPGAWTISETLEHVVMVGQIYWDDLQKAVKSPPGGGIVANRDVDILWYGIDRTHREAAIATETPRQGVRDLSTALAAYRKY